MTNSPAFRAALIMFWLAMSATLFGQTNDIQNFNRTFVKPVATVPFMAHPPTINGIISPGDWQTLHIARLVSQNDDLLERRQCEFWIGCDKTYLYVAVRSELHPQLGAIESHGTKGNSSDVVFDDAIELWIDNAPDQAVGKYFQIMTNPRGATYFAFYNHTDKVAQNYWRPVMKQAHSISGNTWSAEYAIKLTSLGITDPSKPLGIHVCRDYKNPWDQARWEPRVEGFDAPEKMARVRFSNDVPVIEEGGLQDSNGINIGLLLNNTSSVSIPVRVRLGYNPTDQPRYYKTEIVSIAPYSKKSFNYAVPYFSALNYVALGEAEVTTPAGDVLYHRDFKWQTHPSGPIWDAVDAQSALHHTVFAIGYFPSLHKLRWTAHLDRDAKQFEPTLLNIVVESTPHTSTVTQQGPIALRYGECHGWIKVPGLHNGNYAVEFRTTVGKFRTRSVVSIPFQVQTNFPWTNNKLGMQDVLVPPFTALTLHNSVIGAILRKHTIGGAGLWSQVNSEGTNLLSSPMQIDVTTSHTSAVAQGRTTFGPVKSTMIHSVSRWSAAGIRGSTTVDFDYDGCARITLDIPQQMHKSIMNLDVVIPLRDSLAPLMHACGDGIRFNYGGVVPAGSGVVWSSDKASRNDLQGTFLPYIWVGGPERGLVWFASNDMDWSLDPKKIIPALQLERHGNVLTLRVRIIQTPTLLDHNRHIVFGLMATPAKPMPEHPNWRLYGVDAPSGKFHVSFLGMSMYWGADLYSVVPRGNRYDLVSKIAESQKHFQRDNAFFDKYLAENPDFRNEVNSASTPGHVDAVIPYTNLRGEVQNTPEWLIYQDEWKRTDVGTRDLVPSKNSVDGIIIPVPSRQDYLLYSYKNLLMAGFDGIYWDNMYITSNANPGTGNAYRMADGTVQPDTDIWLLRALAKRMATMLFMLGRPNLTMPHMTNAYLVPVMSFTTINLDWEQHYGDSDFQDRFSRDYTQAVSTGRQGGNVPVVLQGITNVDSAAKRAWVERTRIAVCVPFELMVRESDALYNNIRTYLYTLGYGTKSCIVFNFWAPHPVMKLTGIDGTWIVFDGPKTVAVMVSDYGGGGTAKIKLDTARLGIPPQYTASNWEAPSESWQSAHGAITISNLPKHDFRFIIINKKQ